MATRIDPVSIEPMLPADMEAVQRIDRRCYPAPWLHNAYETELTNPSACYFVARLGREVVGYAGQWVVGGEGHLTTIAVDPAHQRRSIGERLLIALIEEAILRGATFLTLEVREGNRAAQNLYRKYGFHETALRKSYYSDNGENAIVMWANEINTPKFATGLRDLRLKLYAAYTSSV